MGKFKTYTSQNPIQKDFKYINTEMQNCQAAGVAINAAKELMGYSDISVTAKIYTHLVDEVFEQNRKRL